MKKKTSFLSKHPLSPHLWLSALVVFLSLLVVSIGWYWRIPTTKITFQLETESILFQLKEDWTARHQFRTNSLTLNNLSSIGKSMAIPPRKIQEGELPFDLEIEGNQESESIFLKKLLLPAKIENEISIKKDQLKFFTWVKGKEVSGLIQFENAMVNLEGETEQNYSIGEKDMEILFFQSPKNLGYPVLLEMNQKPEEHWRLGGLKVSSLNFTEEFPPDSGNFESVIRQGQVILQEVGKKITLYDSNELWLEGIQTRKLEIRKKEKSNNLHILFEGTVTKIQAGPKDFLIDLRPNLLLYLLSQYQLHLWWGTLVFLWTLFWGGRKIIFKI